jgi:hypothetical protein
LRQRLAAARPAAPGRPRGEAEGDGQGEAPEHQERHGRGRPAGPFEAARRQEGGEEGRRHGEEERDLSRQPLEGDGEARGEEARLSARAHRAARVAHHAPRQRLVHDLREVVFPHGVPAPKGDAELARRQPPAERREQGLEREGADRRGEPRKLRRGEAAERVGAVGGAPEHGHEPDRHGDLHRPDEPGWDLAPE